MWDPLFGLCHYLKLGREFMHWKQDFSGMTFPLSLATIKWWYQELFECYRTFAKEVVKKFFFSALMSTNSVETLPWSLLNVIVCSAIKQKYMCKISSPWWNWKQFGTGEIPSIILLLKLLLIQCQFSNPETSLPLFLYYKRGMLLCRISFSWGWK